jgi:hypothetical protein
MALLDMQRALCRLITDAEFRRRFSEDFGIALQEYSLTGPEVDALSATDLKRLQRYATMVTCKRLDLALGAMPRVRRVLGTDFFARYADEYAVRYPPVPSTDESPMLTEFRRTRAFLQDLAARGDIGFPNFPEILRFEATFYLIGSDPGISAALNKFESTRSFPEVDENDTSVDEFGPATVLERSPGAVADTFPSAACDPIYRGADDAHTVHLLFRKRTGDPKVRITRLSDSSKRLIETCDGRTTISELVTRLCEEFGTCQMEAATARCVMACRILAEQRVLGIVPTGRCHPSRKSNAEAVCAG